MTARSAPLDPALWGEKRLSAGVLGSPFIFDLNFDGLNEVIVTDTGGKVIALTVATGEILWERNLKVSVTAAVAGFFLGAEKPIGVVVGGQDGAVYLLNGNTGELVSKTDLQGAPFNRSPTLLPLEYAQTPLRDGAVLIDDDGKISALEFGDDGNGFPLWRRETSSTPSGPPAVGNVMGTEGISVIVATRYSGIHVLAPETGAEKAVFTGLHGGKEITTPITLADLYGTGVPVILVGDNLGQLHGMKVTQGELTECAGYPVRQLEVATQPPLPVDVDGTGKEDLFYVSAVTITRIRGESGAKVGPSFSASTSIATPLTLITGAKGEKLAYFHDVSGAPYMLNLKTNTETLRSGIKFSGFGKPPVIAGSGPGGESYLLIAHSSQPILRLVLSGIETDHEALQWPCYLGSALHSNRVDD
ncbi:MAG: PQQ-binding-like beta-propeller repeat protein, partial [bacterium]